MKKDRYVAARVGVGMPSKGDGEPWFTDTH